MFKNLIQVIQNTGSNVYFPRSTREGVGNHRHIVYQVKILYPQVEGTSLDCLDCNWKYKFPRNDHFQGPESWKWQSNHVRCGRCGVWTFGSVLWVNRRWVHIFYKLKPPTERSQISNTGLHAKGNSYLINDYFQGPESWKWQSNHVRCRRCGVRTFGSVLWGNRRWVHIFYKQKTANCRSKILTRELHVVKLRYLRNDHF